MKAWLEWKEKKKNLEDLLFLILMIMLFLKSMSLFCRWQAFSDVFLVNFNPVLFCWNCYWCYNNKGYNFWYQCYCFLILLLLLLFLQLLMFLKLFFFVLFCSCSRCCFCYWFCRYLYRSGKWWYILHGQQWSWTYQTTKRSQGDLGPKPDRTCSRKLLSGQLKDRNKVEPGAITIIQSTQG